MKKTTFFAMALAVMSMVSCSNEAGDGGTPDKEGQPVYAQFGIRLPETTRTVADGTNTGMASESAIVDATVYIISNAKVEKKLVLSQKTASDPWLSQIVQVSTGEKTILAIVNGGVYGQDFAEGAQLSDIEAARIADRNAASSATNLLFTSRLIRQKIEKNTGSGDAADKPVRFSIPVERAVAKIVVRDNIKLREGLQAILTKTPGVAPLFAVFGSATKVGLYQRYNGYNPVNVEGIMSDGAWWPPHPVNYYCALAEPGTDLTTISGMGTAITEKKDHGGFYTLEYVTATTSLNHEVTRLYIKVQLTPKSRFTLSDNSLGDSIPVGADYLRVRHKTDAMSNLFFEASGDEFIKWDKDPAHAALREQYVEHPLPYTAGFNYYLVYIHHDDNNPKIKYSVLRNTIYDITIGTVNNFGDCGLEGERPGVPIEDNAFIEATISLRNWTTKTQNSDLN